MPAVTVVVVVALLVVVVTTGAQLVAAVATWLFREGLTARQPGETLSDYKQRMIGGVPLKAARRPVGMPATEYERKKLGALRPMKGPAQAKAAGLAQAKMVRPARAKVPPGLTPELEVLMHNNGKMRLIEGPEEEDEAVRKARAICDDVVNSCMQSCPSSTPTGDCGRYADACIAACAGDTCPGKLPPNTSAMSPEKRRAWTCGYIQRVCQGECSKSNDQQCCVNRCAGRTCQGH